MRLAFLFLALLSSAPAAVLTVTTTGGTFSPVTRANLQAAFDAAACGDEIQIEAGTEILIDRTLELHKDCPPGNEVVVTTTKKDWLPAPDARITPSYRPVIPMLRLQANTGQGYIPIINIGSASGSGYAVSATNKGIKLVGIGLMAPENVTAGSTRAWPFVKLGDVGVCGPALANNQNLTLDRVYMTGMFPNPVTAGMNMSSAIQAAGNNISILNSFFDDFYVTSEYSPGIMINNGGTGYLIRNNYLGSGMTESIHFGNSGPACQAGKVVPSDIVVEHNHSYKSLRWYPNTPYFARQTILKNFFECKSCQNAIFRWNTGENSWQNSDGQYYALTLTTRTNPTQAGATGVEHPSSAKSTNAVRANVDAARTTVTLSCPSPPCAYTAQNGFDYNPHWTVGGCIALATVADPPSPYSGWEQREIVSVTDPWTLVVSAPFSESALTDRRWDAHMCFNKVQNIQAYGNFWKNVAAEVLFGPRDSSGGSGGTGGNLQYENNISVATSPYFLSNNLPAWITKVALTTTYAELSPIVGFSVRHNTGMYGTPQAATRGVQHPDNQRDADGNLKFGGGVGIEEQKGLFRNIAIENNLWGPALGGPGMGKLTFDAATENSSSSRYRYNSGPTVNPWAYEPCSGNRICNSPAAFYGGTAFRPGFRNVAGNDFSLRSTSIYARAAADGQDLGADTRQVALIRDLTVKPVSDHLLFSWSLPEPLRQMPCSLEVSPDAALIRDSGFYTVVNALRPDYFRRADSDHANPRALKTASGTRRWFQVGEDAVVTGDDGLDHSLALTPDTDYYYRLMCGGAVERGVVRTLPAPAAAAGVVQVHARSSAGVQARVRYGSIAGGLINGAPVPCSGGCRIDIPAVPGRSLVYYLDELDSQGAVVRAGLNPTVTPVR